LPALQIREPLILLHDNRTPNHGRDTVIAFIHFPAYRLKTRLEGGGVDIVALEPGRPQMERSKATAADSLEFSEKPVRAGKGFPLSSSFDTSNALLLRLPHNVSRSACLFPL
jgi:hypothetical protein